MFEVRQRADGFILVNVRRHWLALSAALVLLLPVVGWGYLQLPQARLAPGLLELPVGSSAAQLGKRLREEHGMTLPVWAFRWLARTNGSAARLQAGEYVLSDAETVGSLLQRVVAGDVVRRRVALIEGWSFREVQAALNRSIRLRHELKGMSQEQIRSRLGIQRPNLEGLFLADTYEYVAGMSDVDILKLAHRRMETALAEAWSKRAPGLPYVAPYEALIMASLIEKETGRADERDDIAAVFVRRLRLGMRLQTDPTVIYALGAQFDGNIRKADLALDSPYNTYVYTGLPPTPIALCGPSALHASLHPAPSNALYFVARGDGSSEFSSDLGAHERAVNRYQRGQ